MNDTESLPQKLSTTTPLEPTGTTPGSRPRPKPPEPTGGSDRSVPVARLVAAVPDETNRVDLTAAAALPPDALRQPAADGDGDQLGAANEPRPTRDLRRGDPAMPHAGKKLRDIPARETSPKIPAKKSTAPGARAAGKSPGARPRPKAAVADTPKHGPLAVARPAADSVVDEKAIDDVAAEIKAICERTAQKGMKETGDLLLRTFYDDDPKKYRSLNPRKNVSLRRLMKLCGTFELPVSKTFLSNSIRLAITARALPADADFNRLPLSHRVELLALPPGKIEGMATKAIEFDLPVRALRGEVRKVMPASPPRGRPRTPEVVRAMKSAMAELQHCKEALGDKKDPGLTIEERATVRTQLRAAHELLGELQRTVMDWAPPVLTSERPVAQPRKDKGQKKKGQKKASGEGPAVVDAPAEVTP